MIHFEGDRAFSLSVNDTFSKLGDASFLVSCLKNVEEIIEQSQDKAIWKLRPGFSFIRGTLEITMEIIERSALSSLKVRLQSRGIGSSSTVVANLVFQHQDTGSKVHWTADVTETTGLLKLVPKALISSAAGKVIEETWTEIDSRLR